MYVQDRTPTVRPLVRAFLLFALLAAALPAATSAATAERLTSAPTAFTADWRYGIDGEGGLWVGFYSADRQLHLRAPDGSATVQSVDPIRSAPSGLAMATMPATIAVVWRDKQPDKNLVLRIDPAESRPLEAFGTETEPLSRIRAFADDRLLHLLWLGERKQDDGTQYNLYYRARRHADGAWTDTERVLPGIYPVWALEPAGSVMVFSWDAETPPHRISARFRAAGAAAFGPEQTIAEVSEITPIFTAFRSGRRWHVLWLAQYGEDSQDFLLEGAYSEDDGATWTRYAFEELRGLDIGSINVATDAAGHVLVALTTAEREQEKLKYDIRLIQSSDAGSTWSAAARLRPIELADQFNARHPSVAFGPEAGQAVVVWEDWREVRSRLYAARSTDFGATWGAEVRLAQPPAANLGLPFDLSAVYADAEGVHVVAEQAEDDSLTRKHLVRLSTTMDALAGPAATDGGAVALDPTVGRVDTADAAGNEDTLRQRFAEFWEAMLRDDYRAAYDFYDPFFRAHNPFERFAITMGRIKYSAFELDSLSIDGHRATVNARVRAAVPEFRMPRTNEPVSRPEQEVPITSVWLWIDDNWYREFYSEAQELRYTLY